MRKATRAVATWFGAAAGVAGIEHGYFEILQGNTQPDNPAFFPSMGPPCDPDAIWNACEPAMSILPNLLITGILAMLLGLAVIVWSAAFLQRRHGGLVLVLLSVALLLFGGGLFPPLIGAIGGAAGMKIDKPVDVRKPYSMQMFAATLWPWPLMIFMVWVWGQFVVGYFFNDFLQSVMGFGVILILVLLPLSVWSAYARDASVQKGE